jgi:hypothetical protein
MILSVGKPSDRELVEDIVTLGEYESDCYIENVDPSLLLLRGQPGTLFRLVAKLSDCTGRIMQFIRSRKAGKIERRITLRMEYPQC